MTRLGPSLGKRAAIVASLVAFGSATGVSAAADPPPPHAFTSTGRDARAIETLVATYARAVTTKNEALFESLLLNKDIPFAYVGKSDMSVLVGEGTRHYEDFRKDVFSGAPFTQTESDVHVLQDGPLAEVSLVYTNRTAHGASWGWKTMQLIDVDGTWKIASEFFTGHRMPKAS